MNYKIFRLSALLHSESKLKYMPSEKIEVLTSKTTNFIVLRIDADYIYKFNTAVLEFTAPSQFSILIKSNITVVELITGKFDSIKTKGNIEQVDKVYRGTEKDKVFTIKLLVQGLFIETPLQLDDSINDSINTYGMQYFPFISSRLKLGFSSLSLPIKAVIVNIPENFRIIWYRRSVLNPNGEEAVIGHSYTPLKSCYVFTWENNTYGDYSMDVLIRLGGYSLWQIIQFPVYYFYTGLFAIFVASFHKEPSVLFAAIIAVWVFLMGHWSKINMPQRNTVMTKIYVFFLFFSFCWGIIWKASWEVGLISMIPLIVLTAFFSKAVKSYIKEGELPERWAKFFYQFNNINDKENRKINPSSSNYTLINLTQNRIDLEKERKKISSPEDEG